MTPDDRRAMKRGVPQIEVADIHVRDARIVPDRLFMLDLLPKNGVAAEIGAAFGDYTREILKRTAPKSLHLVDAWSSERYKAGLAAIQAEHAEQIQKNKLHFHQGLSTEVLPTFADKYFDWVYIDTDHSYPTTWAELVLAEQKTKEDGLICGHDFCVGNVITPWPYGVIEACNQFCVEYGWGYRYLTMEPNGHQSFALKKLP